jgi:hypothetical protein
MFLVIQSVAASAWQSGDRTTLRHGETAGKERYSTDNWGRFTTEGDAVGLSEIVSVEKNGEKQEE